MNHIGLPVHVTLQKRQLAVLRYMHTDIEVNKYTSACALTCETIDYLQPLPKLFVRNLCKIIFKKYIFCKYSIEFYYILLSRT